MKIYHYDALVIGTGCAGFNCADTLYDYGVKNIAILTEGRYRGTSRNTGSDKQTYYKLSLAGNEGDSVFEMAKTLFSGGATDGEIALCEAANSVANFMKLACLGVNFPKNEYGEYVGYKTDHDPYRRATSIGPYTSKKMTEVLERSVDKKGIPVLEPYRAIRILKDGERVTGVLAANVCTGEYIAIGTPYVVLATGGPAAIYHNSVYPESQTGGSALAIEAGAEFVNLSEWQYGLASTDFRWNVSGTYQQVLPRYISIDRNGVEREFLKEFFETPGKMLENIFLKGYEWPFDVRKIHGSSYIDLLVYRESVVLGRNVYLDFTREPSGLEQGFEAAGRTAFEYLENSDALVALPIGRLKKMNEGAIRLYKDHGIDIEKEPLKIAVCAQHNNGGIRVDENWQTSVEGLYACGEAAGTFGVFRPGGTALNSSQTGGMRAARHIAYYALGKESENFEKIAERAVRTDENFREKLKAGAVKNGEAREKTKTAYEKYRKAMSETFSFIRDKKKMADGLEKIRSYRENFERENAWSEQADLYGVYLNRDILVTQELTAACMLETAKRYGSRGSAFVTDGRDFLDRTPETKNTEGREKLLILKKQDGKIVFCERAVHPLPEERELWFEKVWNKYRKEIGEKD